MMVVGSKVRIIDPSEGACGEVGVIQHVKGMYYYVELGDSTQYKLRSPQLEEIYYRTLTADKVLARWQKGEVGVELENDYASKYDHKVQFLGTEPVVLFGKEIQAVRVFYFYKTEVEEVADPKLGQAKEP